MHVTYEQLLQFRTEACPVGGAPPARGGAEEQTNTKADTIQQMLAAGTYPGHGGHALELKKNYIGCGQMEHVCHQEVLE